MATAKDHREMEAAKHIVLVLLFLPLGIACEFWEFLEQVWRGIGYCRAEIAEELEKLQTEEAPRG